jgi:hypothetical protein
LSSIKEDKIKNNMIVRAITIFSCRVVRLKTALFSSPSKTFRNGLLALLDALYATIEITIKHISETQPILVSQK